MHKNNIFHALEKNCESVILICKNVYNLILFMFIKLS